MKRTLGSSRSRIAPQQTLSHIITGIFVLSALSTPQAKAQSTAAQLCPAQIAPAIESILNRPALQTSHWGIAVQPLNTSSNASLLYGYNASKLFLPASNAKLLTTAVALSKFTPQFRAITPLYGTGTAPTLKMLRIIGQGDPALSEQKLTQVAQQLAAQGIRRIENLVGVDTVYAGLPFVPSWQWEDFQSGDGLPINGLILNENVVSLQVTPRAVGQPLQTQWLSSEPPVTLDNQTLTIAKSGKEFLEVYRNGGTVSLQGQLQVGSQPDTIDIPVPNANARFMQRFRRILQQRQIQVDRFSLVTARNHPLAAPTLTGETQVAGIEFPSLAAWIAEVNQDSNNLYAEALLRRLGVTVTPNRSAQDAGLTALRQGLSQFGVSPTSHVLADGSGLSRKNLVSPLAFVQTLQGIARSPYFKTFQDSLAIAGKSGTLARRFLNTPVQGRLYGKTGTLQGVSSLSGYLYKTEPPLVFSIIVNHSNQENAVLRQATDEIVLLLSRLKRCSFSQA
jgi:serine-type D-Ala-D-Ala carboxypeptidase/endopeptidase (penicillin-binding protein 4)